MRRTTVTVFLLLAVWLSVAAAPAWNPLPWLADLQEIRLAIDTRYPNRDWLVEQREVSLDRWFDRTASQIRQSSNDDDARRALDGLITRFSDGHVNLLWPPSAAPTPGPAPAGADQALPSVEAFCAARGYDQGQVTRGVAAALPDYRAIDGGGHFAAGLVPVREAKTIVGIIRIGVFSPQGYPSLCQQAVAAMETAIQKPCDDTCEERLFAETSRLMTLGLITTVERLRAAGAQVLLIDLGRNGGGNEWAEAAARIISPKSLRSAPIAVMRDEKWVKRWTTLADTLRETASHASAPDRKTLLDFARRAELVADAARPCQTAPCPRLVRTGFASGLVDNWSPVQWAGKPWASQVFSPAQFPYRESVWPGPVIVLVDSETWSAAEQFTALLRDNDAAVVLGSRTGGAGCGHLDGNDPITLTNSRAMLELPNCVRFRKDGSNEVNGIVPDILTGTRWNDGAAFAARLTAARLPEAIKQARALAAGRGR